MVFHMFNTSDLYSQMTTLHCALWFMVLHCVCRAEWEAMACMKNQQETVIVPSELLLSHYTRLQNSDWWCNTILYITFLQHRCMNITIKTQTAVKCKRTIRFHPHCGEFGVWEGRVLNIAGHAVLVLQVGGEAEDAALGECAVWVSCVAHTHSEGVIWGSKAVNGPADLRWGPATDGRAWHRLVLSAIYDAHIHEDLHIRSSCEWIK